VMLPIMAAGACGPNSAPLEAGRFGEVRIFKAAGSPLGIVFVFGAAGGWSMADDAAATQLASAGAVVVGVDLPQYLRRLAGSGEPCLYLVADVEKLSRQVQRREAFARYAYPILAGVGDGGGLAQAILAQSTPDTIVGTVAVDPTNRFETGHPLCRQPPPAAGATPSGAAGFRLTASSGQSSGSTKTELVQFAIHDGPAETQVLSVAPTLEAAMAVLIIKKLSTAAPSTDGTGIDDLPLIEMPAASGAPLVVILSGDGGWRDIDKEIADTLQQRGLAVLGWNSLNYFWRAKTPDELARDLGRAIAFYSDKWRASRIVLVGYSFGADVIPFAVNRLPQDLRRQIIQLSLLGFSTKADFEIHVSGWLGASPSETALPTAPEMAQIDMALVQCFYGAEESDSACPALVARGAEVVETGGGHHFGGEYAALAARIADGLMRRAGSIAVPAENPG
jgi:type IV secretory pathway VirJ component